MLRAARILGLVLLSVGTAACDDEITEIVVVVDADPGVQRAAARIDLVVEGPTGRRQTTSAPVVGASAQSLPFTLGLVPAEGTALGPVTISAIALDGTGGEIASRRARTSFILGRTLLLVLQLEDACVGVTCTDPSTTCNAGHCVAADIDASSLPPFTGTVPVLPGPDASTGTDAGPIEQDAGVLPPSDAGKTETDAGESDAGLASSCEIVCDDGDSCNGIEVCIDDACAPATAPMSCNDGVDCTMDFCSASTCSNIPRDSLCDALPGGRCDATIGCTYSPSCAAGCDDGNDCTNDVCMGTTCTFTAITGPCDDGNACTAGDACSGTRCVGTAMVCDDLNPCTSDSCMLGACAHGPAGGPCSDGNACTMGDMCSGGICYPGVAICMDAGPRDGGLDAGRDGGGAAMILDGGPTMAPDGP